MLISSLTICQDEESYMANMIEFLADVVKPDEMVIVDGGSTDKTLEIIEGYIKRGLNIKLIHNPMPDSFSEQRNLAIDNCSGEWILHIDVDETYSRSIVGLIGDIREGKFDDVTGFAFPTAHLILNDETMLSKTGADPHVRLFKNIPELRFFGSVHEYPAIDEKPLIMGIDGYKMIHRHDVALKHYSLLKNEGDLLSKGKRYLKWVKRSSQVGIPLSGEKHFVDCVNSVTGKDVKPVPTEWL